VREHRFGDPVIVDGESVSQAWDHSAWFYAGHSKSQLGIEGDFDPSEQILGPALLRMRVAFTDNARGKDKAHLKSGRVNGRVLGRRAWADDERLFQRRTQPGKKSYFVLIGMDISGSTLGRNIILEKRAVMAQAELCHRMGVKFAVIAHTGSYHNPHGTRSEGLDLDMYFIKDADQPWNEETKNALRAIGPDSANLDGHSLEYYRKMIEKRRETNKIIMYYSDGKMPAENHDEELMILQREIKTCKRKNILLLGVGIRTDSPSRHGLDTVQVDDDEDIKKVVKHLEKRLSVHTAVG
jgi:cobalamin biosynthesis protein CobT